MLNSFFSSKKSRMIILAAAGFSLLCFVIIFLFLFGFSSNFAYADEYSEEITIIIKYDYDKIIDNESVILKGESDYTFLYAEGRYYCGEAVKFGEYRLYIDDYDTDYVLSVNGLTEYEINLISVRYDKNGADGGVLPFYEEHYVRIMSEYSVLTSEIFKSGYAFLGYGDKEGNVYTNITLEKSTVFYAVWKLLPPKVAFENAETEFCYGDTIKITAEHILKEKEGSIFTYKWYIDNSTYFVNADEIVPKETGRVMIRCETVFYYDNEAAESYVEKEFLFLPKTVSLEWVDSYGNTALHEYIYNANSYSVSPKIVNIVGENDDISVIVNSSALHVNAGKYVLNPELMGNDLKYYELADDVSFEFSILKSKLTDITKDMVCTYGNYYYLPFKFDGFLGNDKLSDVDNTTEYQAFYKLNDGEETKENIFVKNAGTYRIGYRYEFQNYETITGEKKIIINPMPITIKIGNKESFYGDAIIPLDFELGQMVPDEKKNLGITLTKESGYAAGHYKITGVCNNNNYLAEFVDGDYEIKKKIIFVEIDDKQSVYGKEQSDLTYRIINGGELSGDDLKIKLTKSAGAAVGEYDISAEYNNSNYAVTFEKGIYTINPALITVFIDDKATFYGESLAGLTFRKPVGVYADDDLNVVLQKQAGIHAGEYIISGRYDNANYIVEFVNGIYRILPKEIAVKIDDKSTFYGQPLEALTYSVDTVQIIGDDDLNITLSTDVIEKYAGQYKIKGSWCNSDYNVVFTDGKYEIIPINLKISVDNVNSVYGDETGDMIKETKAKYQIVSGDVISKEELFIYLYTEKRDSAGTYEIKGICGNNNYNVEFLSGTHNVEKAVLLDNTTDMYAVYDGESHSINFNINGFAYNDNLQSGIITYSIDGLDYFDNFNGIVNVAESGLTLYYKINFDNYEIVENHVKLFVKRNKVEILLDDKISLYGRPIDDLTYTVLAGEIAKNDELNIAMEKEKGSEIGRYLIMATYNNDNYDIKFINGIYTITKPQITALLDDGKTVVEFESEIGFEPDSAIIIKELNSNNLKFADYEIKSKNISAYEKIYAISIEYNNADGDGIILPKDTVILIKTSLSESYKEKLVVYGVDANGNFSERKFSIASGNLLLNSDGYEMLYITKIPKKASDYTFSFIYFDVILIIIFRILFCTKRNNKKLKKI